MHWKETGFVRNTVGFYPPNPVPFILIKSLLESTNMCCFALMSSNDFDMIDAQDNQWEKSDIDTSP